VDKKRYEHNEDCKVSFVNENRQINDWVGFFPACESNDDLRSYEIWRRTCGNKRCQKATFRDMINVRAALPPGTWKVVLARESDEPYDAYAISDTFEVSEECAGEEERGDSISADLAPNFFV
jgi:hypothetical protein